MVIKFFGREPLLNWPVVEAVKMITVVSLDGMQEANLARLIHDGKKSFSMVDQGLKLLAQEGLECSVASVLSEENFDSLGTNFLEYLESRLVKSWEIKLAMQNDGSVARSAAEYAEKLTGLYTRGRDMRIALSYSKSWG